MFFLFWIFGCFVLTAFGYPLSYSMFEFASAVGNVGLNSAIFSATNNFLLWFLLVAMILGRLEFITVFVSISRILGDCFKFKIRKKGKPDKLN